MANIDQNGHFDLDETAQNYCRFLEPYLFAPWSRRLVDRARLKLGQVVLDVAAGTGAVARAAASTVGKSGQVIASDISPAMLSWVEREAEPALDSAPVTTLVCSATNLELPDESVDVVFCQQGFQFMPEKQKVASEVMRVLRSGGTVAFAVWSTGAWISPLDDYEEFVRTHAIGGAIENVLPRELFRMTPGDIAHHLANAGFSNIVAHDEHLTVRWPSRIAEAQGILGTPFGRRILECPVAEQNVILAELALSGGGDHVTTAAVVSGRKP